MLTLIAIEMWEVFLPSIGSASSTGSVCKLMMTPGKAQQNQDLPWATKTLAMPISFGFPMIACSSENVTPCTDFLYKPHKTTNTNQSCPQA